MKKRRAIDVQSSIHEEICEVSLLDQVIREIMYRLLLVALFLLKMGAMSSNM